MNLGGAGAAGGISIGVDDEGYTSPADEDFKHKPVSTTSASTLETWTVFCDPPKRELTWNKPLTYFTKPSLTKSWLCRNLEDGGALQEVDDGRKESIKDEEAVPWDEVAKIPCARVKYLSWDCLQAPFPHRFQPNHVLLYKNPKKIRDERPFTLDSTLQSNKFLRCFWKANSQFDRAVRQEGCTLGGGDNVLQNNEGSIAVQKLRESLEKPTYIPMKQFLKQAIHVLSGVESNTFHVHKCKGGREEFRKNPVILVDGIGPSALWEYCIPIITCGSVVKRLNQYSVLQFDNELLKKQGFERSAVMIAFLRFISNYMKMYQTVLMLNASSISGLTQLLKFIRPFKDQLEALENILESNSFGNAVDLLKTLNILMFLNETPHISDLVRGLFITCASAYLKYVSDWVFRGVLAPRAEFHIQKSKDALYKDRRYWTKQFLHSSSVPMFLEESVHMIFETGKAINLMSRIQNENIYSPLPLFCFDTDDLLALSTDFSQVFQLQAAWKNKLEEFLSEQSELIQDISVSLKSLITDIKSSSSIDFDAIEQAKTIRQEKILAERQRKYEDVKKMKQKYLKDLQSQVKDSLKRRSIEVDNTKLQELRDVEYVNMRDQRDLSELKRIRKKHHGDDHVEQQCNKKDIFSRLHSAPAGCLTTAEKTDVELSFYSQGSISEVEVMSATRFGNQPNSEKVEVIQDDFVPAEEYSGKAENLLLAKECGETDVDGIVSYEIKEQEEKFDPDKILTAKPPAYKGVLSYDSDLAKWSTFVDLDSLNPEMQKCNATCEMPSQERIVEPVEDPFCLTQFLSYSVLVPISAQYRMVNTALLHYFICEKNLFSHVHALNDFLCLHNGLFGQFTTELLIKEVSTKSITTIEDIMKKSERLNRILDEALVNSMVNEDRRDCVKKLGFTINKDYGRSSSRLSASESSPKEKSVSSIYEVLDSVCLSYAVEWPLNIILTEDLLFHYKKLWLFLMQLFRADLLLKRTYNLLKIKNVKSRQLFTLCHYHNQLSHFVRTVRNYVHVTVIHSTWDELSNSFEKLNSLEKIYEALVRHIKTINTNCLLGQKAEDVFKLLKNQLVIIEVFCTQLESIASSVDWKNGEEIPSDDFKRLSQKCKAIGTISKVFTDVAYKLVLKGYYPKIAYFLELYNFNGYFESKCAAEMKPSKTSG